MWNCSSRKMSCPPMVMLETQRRQPVQYNIDVREWQDLKIGVPEVTCETCTSGLVTQCFSTSQRRHFPSSSSHHLRPSPSPRHVCHNFPTAQRIPEKKWAVLGSPPYSQWTCLVLGSASQRPDGLSVSMDLLGFWVSALSSRWSCSVVGSAPFRPHGRLSCVEVELS